MGQKSGMDSGIIASGENRLPTLKASALKYKLILVPFKVG